MIDLLVSNLEASSAAEEWERTLITDMVASYNRQTNAFLGDAAATVVLDVDRVPVSQLSVLFEKWLGWWLLERTDGFVPTFSGQIVTMRLTVDGRGYSYSMRGLYNHIRVLYSTTPGGSVSVETRDDTASQTRWGKRGLIYNVSTAVAAGVAADIADDLIASLAAAPRPELVELSAGATSLEIEVEGCGQLGHYGIMGVPASGFLNLDTMIGNTTDSLPRWTRGRIESNTRQAHVLTEPTSSAKRLEDLLAVAGPGWYVGCYGKPELDFYYASPQSPYYKVVETRHGYRFDVIHQGPVAPSMVRPGQYAIMEPVRVGMPSTMLIGDIGFDLHDGLSISVVMEDRLARLEYDIEQGLAEMGVE